MKNNLKIGTVNLFTITLNSNMESKFKFLYRIFVPKIFFINKKEESYYIK